MSDKVKYKTKTLNYKKGSFILTKEITHSAALIILKLHAWNI